MTNMDAIRKWSDEEFADFVAGLVKKTTETISNAVGIDYNLPNEIYEQARAEFLAWLREEAGR